ncbi:hypothetical protein [Formosa algae]|uniref:hypothetical protein n=1 Tax=Formosa algae TaxID=225843 RepID=UPI00209BFBEC|nr:hypothetical protein [Formosa algae]
MKSDRTFYLTLANENVGNMRGNVLKLSGEFKNYINAHKKSGLRFKYDPMPNESHGTVGLPSIFFGLRFIFEPIQYKTPKTEDEIMALGGPDKSIEKTIKYYNQLSEKFGYKITSDYALNDLGYSFLRIEKFKKYAVKVFKIRVESNPYSFDAYSDLGFAFEELGELQKAKLNYKMALQLIKEAENPEWEFYQINLDKLEKKIKAKN